MLRAPMLIPARRAEMPPLTKTPTLLTKQQYTTLLADLRAIIREDKQEAERAAVQSLLDAYWYRRPPTLEGLSWAHYRILMQLHDPSERAFYEELARTVVVNTRKYVHPLPPRRPRLLRVQQPRHRKHVLEGAVPESGAHRQGLRKTRLAAAYAASTSTLIFTPARSNCS